jgi:hypothetical protein
MGLERSSTREITDSKAESRKCSRFPLAPSNARSSRADLPRFRGTSSLEVGCLSTDASAMDLGVQQAWQLCTAQTELPVRQTKIAMCSVRCGFLALVEGRGAGFVHRSAAAQFEFGLLLSMPKKKGSKKKGAEEVVEVLAVSATLGQQRGWRATHKLLLWERSQRTAVCVACQ